MRRLIQMPARRSFALTLAAMSLCVSSVPGNEEPRATSANGAPFDKALYGQELSLLSWYDPADLAANWSGKNIVLRDVFLSAGGHWGNDVYAGSCKLARGEETYCPKVFLGDLPAGEVRAHLDRIGSGTVNVYLTVGQIVPRPFPRQFGMFEAADGAWVEVGDGYFHVNAASRGFAVPKEQAEPGPAGPDDSQAAPAADITTPEPVPPEERLLFKYRSFGVGDDPAARGEFLPLDRTALLGSVAEFHVESRSPEESQVEGIVVLGHEGDHQERDRNRFCESSTDSNRCEVEFGNGIAGRSFGIAVSLRGADGESRTLTRDFITLDAHPTRVGSTGRPAPLDRGSAEASPVDEITRLVRVETTREEDHGIEYRVDLPPEAFSLKVTGVPDSRITSVTRPADDTPVLIPIFLNVAPYFVERDADAPALEWADAYTQRAGGIVPALRDGLMRAARGGVDAEYMVVDYALTARLFGPFRLFPGQTLTGEQKGHNDRTLDALVDHLLEPPLPAWRARRDGEWISDVSSPLHTLDVLYFRTFPGLVGALLLSDGSNNPATLGPIYQSVLWVDRVEQANEILSSARFDSALAALDAGHGVDDDAITEYLVAVDERSPYVARGLAALIRSLDPVGPAGFRSREESPGPQMDALLVPGATPLGSNVRSEFGHMIRERFGGEVYRLYRVRKTAEGQLEEVLRDPSRLDDTKSVGQMIRRVYDQLRSSYIVQAEIPKDVPAGSQQTLTFKVREAHRTGKGKTKYRTIDGRVRYLSRYTSSGTARESLVDLAGSPFSLIRLLIAYELRKRWDDPSLDDLLYARLVAERDRRIRRVLFESAVVRNLKRLQVGEHEVPDPADRRDTVAAAYAWLQRWAGRADESPDPRLAQQAGRLAGLFRRRFPQRFE